MVRWFLVLPAASLYPVVYHSSASLVARLTDSKPVERVAEMALLHRLFHLKEVCLDCNSRAKLLWHLQHIQMVLHLAAGSLSLIPHCGTAPFQPTVNRILQHNCTDSPKASFQTGCGCLLGLPTRYVADIMT